MRHSAGGSDKNRSKFHVLIILPARRLTAVGRGVSLALALAGVFIAPLSGVLEHLKPRAGGQGVVPLLRHVRPL